MRKVKLSIMSDEVRDLREDIHAADWKDRPETVLESVDLQLSRYGLEIVMYDTGGDWYEWGIQPVQVSED
jgi:hypothetical protein